MKYIKQYNNEEEREQIINKNSTLTLIEEQNITEGNFLIFSDDPENDMPKVYMSVPEEEFQELKQENIILKAQNKALADQSEFHSDVLTEIILTIAP